MSDPDLEISGVNFTDVPIEEFSIDGHYGPGIYPNGGGAGSCAASKFRDAGILA